MAEIDLQERVWSIPATRMKAGKPHRLPLSDRVVEILAELPREAGSDFVFIGDRPRHPLHQRALFCVLQPMRRGLTVHGFRSSFADWAAESSFDGDAIEKALAHTVGTKVKRAYQRTDLFDKRRTLMDAWAAFCLGETPKDNVVQLRAV